MKVLHCLVMLLVLTWFALPPSALADSPLPPQFRELGHNYPGFEQPERGQFAVADFDQDGKEDFAFVAITGANNLSALFVVGKTASGEFVFKQQTLIPDTGVFRVLAVRQPVGAAHVLTVGYDGIAREYGGWPLAPIQQFTTLASPTGAAVGDVFGDSVPRVVVRTDSQLGVYDVATGTQKWLHPSSGSGDITLAQLDADPALEIILGGSAPGLVLDGASGQVEWQYPDSFGYLLASGSLGPASAKEFVGAGYQVAVFSGAPYSPLFGYTNGLYFTVTALAVGDVFSDGHTRILFAGSNGGVQILDGVTGLATALPNANFPSKYLALADVDGNGTNAILFADDLTVGIASAQTGGVIWRATSRASQFNVAAVGDIKSDGTSELLTGYAPNIWGQGAAGLEISDMASGKTLADLADPSGNAGGAMQIVPSRILVDNEVPQSPLIVLAGSAIYDGRVVVVDGTSQTVALQLGAYSTGPFASRSISDAILIDMDGDGVKDILVASQPDLGWVDGAMLQAFTMSGQPIWNSIGMGTSSFAINGVLGLSPSSGAGDVVVAVLPGSLRAFDRLSHLETWTLDVANNGAVLVPHGVAGVEIAIESGSIIAFYDAATRHYIRQISLSDSIDAITPLDGRVDQLLVSSGGALHLVDGAGNVLASTPYLGEHMAQPNQLAVEKLVPGAWRIAVGGAIGIYRYELDLSDTIFGAGFE
ncbi:hypothetical protein ELE36_14655 [Pseudolysobacter antarcticus]|uniref:VCBS repeat-containing protein n=1 Tax=Pseudolysobacter antarcticus TaxID=2511995 RepID=A0A411HLU9_9GAMM|nr:hypothetical protein [Pseudolysobacter antarcticus]QBB71495.1 hypothetical protein ELE36_14655 [Pseudolysobacter antarcticus]